MGGLGARSEDVEGKLMSIECPASTQDSSKYYS